MTDTKKLYPRTGDKQTVYLKNVITDPSITVGDYTMYNDFVNDPVGFERNNVLYHYPANRDRLIIGKNFVPLPAAQSFSSTAQTTPSLLSPPTPFPFSLRNGDWKKGMWPLPGTTKEILSSEMMCGSDMRQSLWQGLRLETEP